MGLQHLKLMYARRNLVQCTHLQKKNNPKITPQNCSVPIKCYRAAPCSILFMCQVYGGL